MNINNARFTGKQVEEAWELTINRDHFAMYALSAVIAKNELHDSEKIAKIAWSIADAMMKTRNPLKDGK